MVLVDYVRKGKEGKEKGFTIKSPEFDFINLFCNF